MRCNIHIANRQQKQFAVNTMHQIREKIVRKKCMTSRTILLVCSEKYAARPNPNISAKNTRHKIEFEKPKTDDCQAPNTFEQLMVLFKSHARGAAR